MKGIIGVTASFPTKVRRWAQPKTARCLNPRGAMEGFRKIIAQTDISVRVLVPYGAMAVSAERQVYERPVAGSEAELRLVAFLLARPQRQNDVPKRLQASGLNVKRSIATLPCSNSARPFATLPSYTLVPLPSRQRLRILHRTTCRPRCRHAMYARCGPACTFIPPSPSALHHLQPR
ncbi:hypothetical protein BC834DRAFT_543160 [Gloeopeniophorella convolvens]|nr:hypothetical protein BC834DRAFT_543160 [Gloeopeniophorella convolvens]